MQRANISITVAQADALEIEAGAKRRLADEYDAAQERREIAKAGNPNSSSAEELPGAADIGLTHKDIHEARIIRDAEAADPGIERRALDEKLAAGEEPTKAALRRTAEDITIGQALICQKEALPHGSRKFGHPSYASVKCGCTMPSVARTTARGRIEMLRIPTYLAESKIQGAGLGLFCKEAVPSGTVIWAFDVGFDYVVDQLPDDEILRNFVLKYGYLPITGEIGWVMCADDARFFNHSDAPTCLDFGPHTTARDDLAPGTELTSDYRSFCRDPFLGFPDHHIAREAELA